MSNLTPIGIIAAKDIRDALQDRFILIVTGFLGLAAAVALATGAIALRGDLATYAAAKATLLSIGKSVAAIKSPEFYPLRLLRGAIEQIEIIGVAIAILIGFYKAVLSIGQVSEQAAALADVLPTAARAIIHQEIERLANASARTVSAQSFFAVVIGGYAAHRGFKALLAGLNLIHDESEPHGFFKFNLLAFFVALAAFLLFTVVSGAVVTSRLLEHAGPGREMLGVSLPATTIGHPSSHHCPRTYHH